MLASIYTEYGSAEVLQVKTVAKPTPELNEVLVRVYVSTVTPPDIAARKGDPLAMRLFSGLLRPKGSILGGFVAGEIEAVGKDVKRFKPGDQIVGSTGPAFGAHAEYICLTEDAAIIVKPPNMSYEASAGVFDGVLTALPFIRDEAGIQSGQKVLINGASGSIGTVAVQLAKYYGAEVTGVCSTANLDLVKSLGADHVIDYTREDFTNNGRTYDVIFDAVGKSSFSRAKKALRDGGIYLTTVPSSAILVQTIWTRKFGRKKAAVAFTGLRSTSDRTKDLEFTKALVEAGKIRPVVDRHYPLAEVADAHRYVETGHKIGNVVLKM